MAITILKERVIWNTCPGRKEGQFFDKVNVSNYPIIKDDSETELRYTQKTQGYIICLILTFSHDNPIRKIRLYILCLKIFQLFFLDSS